MEGMDFTLLVYTLLNAIHFLPQLLILSQDWAVLVCLLSCFIPVLLVCTCSNFQFLRVKDAAGSVQWARGSRANEHLARWLVVGCVHFVLFYLENGWWEAEWLYATALGTMTQWSDIMGLCPGCFVENIQSSRARRTSRWCRKALICWR